MLEKILRNNVFCEIYDYVYDYKYIWFYKIYIFWIIIT